MAILPALQEDLGLDADTALQIAFGFSVPAEFQIYEKSEKKISFLLF